MNKLQILTATSVFLSPFTANAALLWHSALDGNANAIVGPDGVAFGAPTPIADLNGNPNGAVKFNGSTDYFDLGVISSTLGAGSMSFWARTDLHGNDWGPIAMGVSGAGAAEYFSIQDRADGSWRADVDNGASRLDVFDNDPPVPTGTWHHVGVTFLAGGDLKMYINGVLQDDVQALTAGHDLANLGTWLVGAERVGSRYYNGALDDVRLYDNELTAGEMSALSAAGPLYNIPEPSTSALVGLAGLAMLLRRRA